MKECKEIAKASRQLPAEFKTRVKTDYNNLKRSEAGILEYVDAKLRTLESD